MRVCVFPSSEGDGVVDVCDDILFLSDVAVQPVHPARSGSHHIHTRLCRLLNNYTGMATRRSRYLKGDFNGSMVRSGFQTPK